MRAALFCAITQRVVVTTYRRFGTTSQSLHWCKALEYGIDTLHRNASTLCEIAQKSAVFTMRHTLGLDRLFQVVFVHSIYSSASPFAFPLLFILVACCRQLCLFLLSILSTGSTFSSSKISLFLLWSLTVYPVVILKTCVQTDVSRFMSFCLTVQVSLPYRRMGERQLFIYFYSGRILDPSWYKVLFKILRIEQILLGLLNIFSFIFIENFTSEIFTILYLLT
jgi:hypothetical protein